MKFLFDLKKVRYLLFFIVMFSLLVGCSSSGENVDISYSSDTEVSYIDSSAEDELSEIEEEDNSYEENEYYEEENNDSGFVENEKDKSYDEDNDYDEDTHHSEHYGEKVYIAKGNSYYHKISNCKYLEGADTTKVTLDSSLNKYECNCFENPVVYKPKTHHTESESHHSGSSGNYVYIASGNSYYHKSSDCKFLDGASTKKVSLSNVGGKHPCNCIKY